MLTLGNTLWNNDNSNISENFLKGLIKSSYRNGIKPISIEETEKGVSIKIDNGNLSLNDTPGVYAIFNENELIYIGGSSSSIRYRVYRFCKEILHKSRNDEGHSAGKKYRYFYGKKYNLKLMYIPLYDYSSEEIKDIELTFIRRFNPKFNKRKIK